VLATIEAIAQLNSEVVALAGNLYQPHSRRLR
jgi:hypothetical protein